MRVVERACENAEYEEGHRGALGYTEEEEFFGDGVMGGKEGKEG
jgi:hypothetical protein